MLRPHGSVIEQIAFLERPIPPLLATRLFTPSPYRVSNSARIYHSRSHRPVPECRDGRRFEPISSLTSFPAVTNGYPKPLERPHPPTIQSQKAPLSRRHIHSTSLFRQNASNMERKIVSSGSFFDLSRKKGDITANGWIGSNPALFEPDQDEIEKHYYAKESQIIARRRKIVDTAEGRLKGASKDWTQRIVRSRGPLHRMTDRAAHRIRKRAWNRRWYDIRRRASLKYSQDGTEHASASNLSVMKTLLRARRSPRRHSSDFWSVGFTRVRARYERKLYVVPSGQQPVHNSKLRGWIEEYERHSADVESATEYWKSLTKSSRSKRWPHLMLHYLETSPSAALSLLRDILPAYKPPSQQVVDVFSHIVRMLIERKPKHRPNGVASQAFETLQFCTWQYGTRLHVSGLVLRSLIAIVRPVEVLSMLKFLKLRRYPVDGLLNLSGARSLAKFGESEDAIGLIQEALRLGVPPESKWIELTVTHVVRWADDTSGNFTRVSDLVGRLFEMEIRLMLPTYNVLILKAAQAKDQKTAWQIFNMISENGIEADEDTYIVMMQMTRLAQDRHGFRTLYRRLNPENRDTLKQWLVTEILQCRHVFNERDNFDHVLRFYERHCDLQQLKDLGILPPWYESRFAAWYSSPRPLPSTPATTVVLLKYIQSRSSSKVRDIVSLYLKFKNEIARENPNIIPLAGDEYLWNGLIKGLSREDVFFSGETWRGKPSPLHWVKVMRTMTRQPSAHVINRDTGKPLERLKPTKHTWNILLNAHARTGNVREADRILTNMKKNDMEPDVVTWNSLLGGFSRFQHMGLVATVLQRMKETRTVADDHTAKALAPLNDREGLLETMRTFNHGHMASSLRDSARQQHSPQLVNYQTRRQGLEEENDKLPLPRGRRFMRRALKMNRHLDRESRRAMLQNADEEWSFGRTPQEDERSPPTEEPNDKSSPGTT